MSYPTNHEIPFNPTTGNEYQGNNIDELLAIAEEEGYPTNQWAGMKQWNKVGRKVTSSPHYIELWFPKRDKKNRKVMRNGKPVLVRRVLRVYNIAQTEEGWNN